ncbi:MAG TPA: response regulator [Ferrovibrio sp.]|jgi:two-component system cell cycle response regulator CpdR|uniref:response regulator n=1 Tax=Ferrovibrio sp. TaxID=1917215 RepID=UPI002B4ACE45|nr:response regulator [Ferrovibrio sp.]HLT77627.1 response regulator [Ferrovibrio sp.]
MARILVAEDEVPMRAFIRRVLAMRGHEVVAVADGAEAVQKLSRESFDLLITDIGMPNMDGVELALKAARDWPDLRLLLMSGLPLERQQAHGIGELAQAVLQKPFTMVALNDAVEAALGAARVEA